VTGQAGSPKDRHARKTVEQACSPSAGGDRPAACLPLSRRCRAVRHNGV